MTSDRDVDSKDNVIDFTIKDKWRHDRPRKQIRCDHWHIELDEETRLVECVDCQSIMDGFNWLHNLACSQRHWSYLLTSLHKEHDELAKSVDELKREERNIKARIRNARGKL